MVMRKFFTALVVIPLGIFFIIFAVANRHLVTVSFDPFNSVTPTVAVTLPLFVVIIAVAMLGVLAGGMASWFRQGKWRRAARQHEAEAQKVRSQLADLRSQVIAVPGTLTTAYLALRMCLGLDFKHVVVPFDQILDAVEAGEYQGQPIEAGLIIHEGQLTYGERGLKLIVDTGQWWFEETGLPLPLGANAIRKDLGPETMHEVNRLPWRA